MQRENAASPIRHVMNYYKERGNLEDTITLYLEGIKCNTGKTTVGQEFSFYLNSSDSLETLREQDYEGKKVLTVSGSGEFPHVFIESGAAEIYAFDISPAAAFNSELRHTALCNLTMDEYIELFSACSKRSITDDSQIYDQQVYKKIRDQLSNAAKIYFDLLFKDQNLNRLNGDTWGGFARLRSNRKTGYNRFIGDIITTDDEYNKLQAKAKGVRFTQTIVDATQMDELILSVEPDIIYQSNIGYSADRIIEIAYHNLQQGVSNVICTLSPNDDIFEADYTTGEIYYLGKKVHVGDEIEYDLRNTGNGTTRKARIKILGIDENAEYGITIMLIS